MYVLQIDVPFDRHPKTPLDTQADCGSVFFFCETRQRGVLVSVFVRAARLGRVSPLQMNPLRKNVPTRAIIRLSRVKLAKLILPGVRVPFCNIV